VGLTLEGPEYLAAVKHAEEVAQILKQNIVQGRKVEGEEDKYSKCNLLFLFYFSF